MSDKLSPSRVPKATPGNDPCIACDYSPKKYARYVGAITLPLSFLSRNAHGGNGRNSWKYRGIRNDYLRAIQGATPGIPPAKCKRRLWIWRLYAHNKRNYDPDNLHGGLKPILDSLKKTGLILDDRESSCEYIVKQERLPSDRDEILIEFFDL